MSALSSSRVSCTVCVDFIRMYLLQKENYDYFRLEPSQYTTAPAAQGISLHGYGVTHSRNVNGESKYKSKERENLATEPNAPTCAHAFRPQILIPLGLLPLDFDSCFDSPVASTFVLADSWPCKGNGSKLPHVKTFQVFTDPVPSVKWDSWVSTYY